MHRRVVGSLCLVSLTFTGCIIDPAGKASTTLSAQAMSKWVQRGQTFIDRPVVQSRLAMTAPTKTGDNIRLIGEGVMPLGKDTGDAWFPDGHEGRFAQVDLIGSYVKTIDAFTFEGGVHNYVLPNGNEFINGPRGTTSEAFVRASANVLEATPYIALHYDFDEVKDWYYRAGITEDFDLGKGFSISLDGSVGYFSNGQAQWLFGADQAGLGDVRGTAALNYAYDANTTFNVSINGSRIADTDIARWMKTQNQYTTGQGVFATGIDPDPIWVTIGGAFFF